MFARHDTAYHVEKLIAGFRRANRLQEAAANKEARESRSLKTRWDEGGFACEVNRQGAVVFKSPRGNLPQEAFRMEAPAAVHEPVAWIKRQVDCDHVDSKTGVTRWTGSAATGRWRWGICSSSALLRTLTDPVRAAGRIPPDGDNSKRLAWENRPEDRPLLPVPQRRSIGRKTGQVAPVTHVTSCLFGIFQITKIGQYASRNPCPHRTCTPGQRAGGR